MAEQALSPTAAVILEWCFVALALVFTLLRLFVRYKQTHSLNASDYTIIAATVCFAASTCCDTTMIHMGFWDPSLSLYEPGPNNVFNRLSPELLEELLKILFASTPPYYLSFWLVKVALLLLYYSLVPRTMAKARIALHIISFIVGATLIAVLAVNFFWCMPISSNWDISHPNGCIAYYDERPYLSTYAMHVSTEILIFVYPLVVISRAALRSTRDRIWQVLVMFAVGFLAMIVSTARLIFNFTVGQTSVIGPLQAFAGAEQAISIIVCCLPAFRHVVASARKKSTAASSGKSGASYGHGPTAPSKRSNSEKSGAAIDTIEMGNWRTDIA